MFTGIVQRVGQVAELNARGGDIELVIKTGANYLDHTALGDSIAVNGCCLTVTRLLGESFAADVSRETLQVTTLNDWRVGAEVNLEKALRAGDALGGHYVTGHVDGIAEVLARSGDARSERLRFGLPKRLGRYVAKKGSITVDGVSLTVNEVSDSAENSQFEVNLVPHTLEVTILKHYQPGQRVNVEVDIIARYLDRMKETTGGDL
jgi:riboflavin synthase